MELFKVYNVDEARRIMLEQFKNITLDIEELEIEEALDRYLAEDVISEIDVPHFRRSTVDGYALISKDTHGASESIPALFMVIDEVEMGKAATCEITPDTAAYVPTGGMVPTGADSVVMVEYTEAFDSKEIAVYKSMAPKENIIDIGDDIRKGSKVLSRGSKIRAQDIGVLSSIGIRYVKVYKKPQFILISTGDEIVAPEYEALPGQIRDVNTFTLSGLIRKIGGIVKEKHVIKDDYEALKEAIKDAIEKSDMVVLSGGSSVGAKDISAKVINQLGEPGVFVHGVAIKPGKPTIIGNIKNKPIFGLPGQPTSAMIVFSVFVEYFIKHLMGAKEKKPFINAISAINIHSSQGKETYQMVILEESENEFIARPVYGKSGMITLMSRAEGYIKIPTNKEGVKKGEQVKVYLF